MSPILGIYASSQQTSKLSNYYSISTATVTSGGTASITFSSIPSTYTHLQLRWFSTKNTTDFDVVDFNGNSTQTNYASHLLEGTGAAAQSSSQIYPSATTSGVFGHYYSSGSTYFVSSIMDILDYTNTNKYKTTRLLHGQDMNGSGYLGLYSGLFMNTAAITSITIYANPALGGAFNQYSSFALYGVK